MSTLLAQLAGERAGPRRVSARAAEHVDVEDHELEELESFDGPGDETADPGRTHELEGFARDGVDRDGRIVDRVIGPRDWVAPTQIAAIEALLAARPAVDGTPSH